MWQRAAVAAMSKPIDVGPKAPPFAQPRSTAWGTGTPLQRDGLKAQPFMERTTGPLGRSTQRMRRFPRPLARAGITAGPLGRSMGRPTLRFAEHPIMSHLRETIH